MKTPDTGTRVPESFGRPRPCCYCGDKTATTDSNGWEAKAADMSRGKLVQAADLSEMVELNLNMPDIVTQAMAPKTGLVWKLDIDCHAAPYKWTGIATSEGAATLKAMADLSDSHPDFNRYKARVVACVQVAS